MADNPITQQLPADLPTNWSYGQTVAPSGAEAGLSAQHGYNYLMQQVNAAQEAINQVGEAFEGLATNKQINQLGEAVQTAQDTADKALEALNKLVYTIEVVPSQQGTLTYTGSAQSPSWNSYNPDVMILGGTTSATNAGTYTATFTPKENYSWSDGSAATKSVPWTIQRQTVAVPAQSGTLTYTGSAQSPSWSGYDSAKLTIGGTTSSTNAGSYSATFTPKANYQWNDGTTGEKSVTWSVGKAAGSLTLSKSAVSLNTSALSDTVTVTRPGTGAITAQTSNDNIATVTVSGNTLTITGKATGTATVTVKVAADGNYTAPANKTVAVTVQLVSTVLAENSWATIGQVCAEKKHKDYWQVGDEKDIVVNGETLTLAIMDFDHDDLADGSGKAPITFGLKNLMAETRVINSTRTNVGGFTGSEIYAWLQNTLLSALPSDLKNVIKSVNKKTSAGSGSSTINTNAMKLFLFSEVEITGSATDSVIGEGTQYSYFATVTNRIKKLQNGAGSVTVWFERSPRNVGSYDFCSINNNGSSSYGWPESPHGVCFALCV